MAAGVHPRARTLGFTLGEIAELLGPAQAHAADDIAAAAEAKLAEVAAQTSELSELQCRLRRLVQVCAQGNRDDCVALQLSEPCAGVGAASLIPAEAIGRNGRNG